MGWTPLSWETTAKVDKGTKWCSSNWKTGSTMCLLFWGSSRSLSFCALQLCPHHLEHMRGVLAQHCLCSLGPQFCFRPSCLAASFMQTLLPGFPSTHRAQGKVNWWWANSNLRQATSLSDSSLPSHRTHQDLLDPSFFLMVTKQQRMSITYTQTSCLQWGCPCYFSLWFYSAFYFFVQELIWLLHGTKLHSS